jgi:hypothetical protein
MHSLVNRINMGWVAAGAVAQPQFSSWGTTLTYSGFTEKFWGHQYKDGPMDQKIWRGTCPPGGCAYGLGVNLVM